MARETIVLLKDDLDGSVADTTVRFGWNGATYEIDLSNANAEALATAIAPYLAGARRIAGRRARRAATSPTRTSRPGNDRAAIRAWAAQNGFKVAERGRISHAVIDAYHKAAGETREPTRRRRVSRKAPAKKAAPTKSARRRQPRRAR